jgi:hypothetical protein
MPDIERAHARFLDGDTTYPDNIASQVDGHLDDVATHVSRGETIEAISAAYAAIGVHEDWLAADA